jgi:toxin ParE1/3/4
MKLKAYTPGERVRHPPHFPRSGRKVPEFDDEDIRESIAYNYRIIYRVEREEILIAAVIHGKRMLQ